VFNGPSPLPLLYEVLQGVAREHDNVACDAIKNYLDADIFHFVVNRSNEIHVSVKRLVDSCNLFDQTVDS
jgi:hypothetical protein